jgi:DNA-binding response OmpR family regulator
MQILIADDDPIALRLLESALVKRGGYEVIAVRDGVAAWGALDSENPPALAILDWIMPGMDGVELCRRVRAFSRLQNMYLILVTGKESREDRLTGLQAGANDYITKPFDSAELEARVRVATRVISLQLQLSARVEDLEATLARVKRLERLLPICMHCKKIRDERNTWHQIESYISSHSDAEFSHGICADCLKKFYLSELHQLEKAR